MFSSIACCWDRKLRSHVKAGVLWESVGCSETLMFPTVGGVGGIGALVWHLEASGAYVKGLLADWRTVLECDVGELCNFLNV